MPFLGMNRGTSAYPNAMCQKLHALWLGVACGRAQRSVDIPLSGHCCLAMVDVLCKGRASREGLDEELSDLALVLRQGNVQLQVVVGRSSDGHEAGYAVCMASS